ncbi:TetR/AcrR family transcriptional regulator [Nocardioides montaniterrae]
MSSRDPFDPGRTLNTREDALTSLIALHATGGFDKLTMSAVAAHLRMSRSSVHAAHGDLAGFYASLTDLFADRWRGWVRPRDMDDPMPVNLPEAAGEQLGVLTWQSLQAVASAEARAGRPDAWEAVVAMRECQRNLLTWHIQSLTGRRPDATDLDFVILVADAVRLRMVDPIDPITLEQARATVARVWPAEWSVPREVTDERPSTDPGCTPPRD